MTAPEEASDLSVPSDVMDRVDHLQGALVQWLRTSDAPQITSIGVPADVAARVEDGTGSPRDVFLVSAALTDPLRERQQRWRQRYAGDPGYRPVTTVGAWTSPTARELAALNQRWAQWVQQQIDERAAEIVDLDVAESWAARRTAPRTIEHVILVLGDVEAELAGRYPDQRLYPNPEMSPFGALLAGEARRCGFTPRMLADRVGLLGDKSVWEWYQRLTPPPRERGLAACRAVGVSPAEFADRVGGPTLLELARVKWNDPHLTAAQTAQRLSIMYLGERRINGGDGWDRPSHQIAKAFGVNDHTIRKAVAVACLRNWQFDW